jgi:hypothetical protein
MTETGVSNMHRRRILLSDGRYLIFYTFADANNPALEDSHRPTNFVNASPNERETPATAQVQRED